MVRLAALWMAAMLFAAPAWSQSAPPPLRVASFPLEPFVVVKGDTPEGFSIDLWNEIARRMGTTTTYRMVANADDMLALLRAGQVDAGVGGLFYSAERDRDFDFSYPILESGLGIMVRDSGGITPPNWLRGFVDLLFSRSSLTWLGIALLLVTIAAHLLWLLEQLERRRPRERYFPAIFHAMYWAATTLLGQGSRRPPRSWTASGLTVLWMFVGIIFVASYTAQLTTKLALREFHGTISGPSDLAGRKVATPAGSTTIPILHRYHAKVHECASDVELYQALLEGKVDAVVLGSAALRYYAAHEGRGQVRLAGRPFATNNVGFAFPLASPLRKRVDHILLQMHEDGTYHRIRMQWLGET